MIPTYEKPVITVDNGLAEGIYAASGTASGDTVSYERTNVYYQENGSKTYKCTFSGNVKGITLTFNQNIDSASANTSVSVSGKSVTASYDGWTPLSPVEITVVVSTGLSTLELTGYTYQKN